MPYIQEEERRILKAIEGVHPLTVGQLGYCIAKLIGYYTDSQEKHDFEFMAKVHGTVALVMADWESRFAIPYENNKRRNNGDIY